RAGRAAGPDLLFVGGVLRTDVRDVDDPFAELRIGVAAGGIDDGRGDGDDEGERAQRGSEEGGGGDSGHRPSVGPPYGAVKRRGGARSQPSPPPVYPPGSSSPHRAGRR